ncbi:hypothetical protein [Devosia sp.]|nr:hypothetical protein [Devosia sp.]MBN9333865.1 hypothetical protein [Devosia sp.]
MIGQFLFHAQSGTRGAVDDQTVHPDGRVLVRINDRWLFADETRSGMGD